MIDSFQPDLTTSLRLRFLETLLESAIDYAIIAINLRGLVTVWNEGARRILGWTEGEMLGQPASIFLRPRIAKQVFCRRRCKPL
jgi:PAS domain S-box-containing protein